MNRSRIHSALAATAILLIFTGICMTQEESSLQLPERCRKSKPKNTRANCTNKTRRWFLHETKGCKRSGYCRDDAENYDTQTNMNYFLSEEACTEACMTYVRCPALKPIPNGNLSDGPGHWGSTVTYTCNEGYSLIGASVRKCFYNATWSSQAPTCQAKCPAPELNQDGHFTIAPRQTGFYEQGDTIVYSCEEGFVNVAASNRRTCLKDGTWSGNEAICEPVDVLCPEPGLIEHGMPNASSFSIGSVLTYKCEEGYMLHGNNTRHCSQEGKWTGENPVCFKFSIEMCMESDCTDVTNRTIALLRQGNKDVYFTPKLSSELSSLSAMDAEWEFESEEAGIAGVEIREHRLVISPLLETRVQVTRYTVRVGSYQAFFIVGDIKKPEDDLSVVVAPKDMAINIGESLKLQCVFRGKPSPEVTWFHNGQPVSEDSRRTISKVPQSPYVNCILSIDNVTQEDLGNYKCQGNNTYGSKDTEFGTVTSTTDTSSTSKRSVMEESPLCRSKAPSNSVTIVGRVKKEARKVRSPDTATYRVEVNRVLSPNSETISRKNLRTIVFDKSTMKLKRNGLYIMQGTLDENTLLVHQHDSILTHSPALERSLLDC